VAERLILVVEDDEPQRRVLAGFLRKRGYEVETAADADEALRLVSSRTVDLVLSDLRMPGRSGVELLDAVRGMNPEIPVVVMTAYGTVASAVDAMKRGAADYLGKPVELDELEVLVARTLERRALVSENRALREQLESRYRLEGLETQNAAMQGCINVAARAAASRAGILIRGESGTGKELLARAIHYASPRRRGPLVAVNVAALPETLLESELFGHERGAFTGADKERRGRFELADGGTLVLDEIGDLPRGTQVKLLRVLQEQSFERLGGSRPIKVDVRVIAATHRDVAAMARSGEFREDLLFRLDVVSITLPPLRERREDIPLLVDHFLRRFADEGRARGVSREAMDLLLKHDYPGNVRELENLVHRAVVLCRGEIVTRQDLPLHLGALRTEGEEPAGFNERVAAFEKRLILEALDKANGVQTRAAAALGMSERHLRYKLKKYGL
jgi:two-component system NtrC family response regulator